MAEEQRPITVASFYHFLNEKKLMASRCPECGGLYLPPKAICPTCYSEDMEWVELGGQGKLAAYTAVHIAPTFMEAQGFDRNNPYLAGVVELDEGVKISARITGLDAQNPTAVEIGTPLTLDFIEQGEGEDAQTVLAFRA